MLIQIAEMFIPVQPLKISVLFLIFNRFEETKLVFEEIRKAKPPKLYIASDGPRKSRTDEKNLIEQIRKFTLDNIDWNCEVYTLFRTDNLSCKVAVSNAIDWFFKNEEMGIILEDDCLPSQSFFWFCEDLLLRYKNDKRVWHISGDNFQDGIVRGEADYYFSNYPHIWGWATWRDRWQAYDVGLKTFDQIEAKEIFRNTFEKPFLVDYWLKIMTEVADGKIDTWDYQWMYTVWRNYGLCALPNQNLISNIGFSVQATHTKEENISLSNLERFEIRLPLVHPIVVLREIEADRWTTKKLFKKNNVLAKTIKKLSKLIVGETRKTN